MLKKRLFDNSFFDLQTGSFIPVPFISNRRREKTQELGWEELQFLRLWTCKLLLQFTGSIDSTFHCLHIWQIALEVKYSFAHDVSLVLG